MREFRSAPDEPMATVRKEAWPDLLSHAVTPIKYLTENGFRILRLCEVDVSETATRQDCRFLVQRDDDAERIIQVDFEPLLVTDLRIRRWLPLPDTSPFWIVCAESLLANYLWEQNDFPPADRLIIHELPPDELMLAVHWRDHN